MAIAWKNCIESAHTNEDVLRVIDHAIKCNTNEGLKVDEIYLSYNDVRDINVRVMRVYAPLHELEEWEPETLTEHQKKQLVVMREILANCDKRRAELRAKA
jgi:hypothetical protein